MLIGFVTFAAGTAALILAKEFTTFGASKFEFVEERVHAH